MKKSIFLTPALGGALPAYADDHDTRYRLVIADAVTADVRVIDLTGEDEVGSFTLNSAARLYLGPDERHLWAVQRDAGIVNVLDSGRVEEDHGDHSAIVLREPALLPDRATGERPVHFNMDGDHVAIFWDGTGTGTLHEAPNSLEVAASIVTGAPHHGMTVPLGPLAISTVAPDGEGLPDALAVVEHDGTELSRLDCLNLHGEGKAGDFVAFGCEDGVALFDTSDVPPSGRFVAYPEDAPEGGNGAHTTETMSVTDRVDVPGTPRSLVLLAAEADHDH